MAEINYRIILKIIGVLLWLEAASMLMPLGISIYYGENDTTAFLITIGIAAVIGSILFFQYPNFLMLDMFLPIGLSAFYFIRGCRKYGRSVF